MNIPNLPTDNLYKFICLSGLALFLLMAFYEVKSIDESIKGRVEIEFRKSRMKIESALIQVENKKFQNRVDAFRKWTGSKPSNYSVDSLMAYLAESMSYNGLAIFKESLLKNKKVDRPEDFDKIISVALIESLHMINDRENKFDSISVEIESADNELKTQDAIKNRINAVTGGLGGFSIFIFMLGAYLWYTRRQKYEDIILEAQAKFK